MKPWSLCSEPTSPDRILPPSRGAQWDKDFGWPPFSVQPSAVAEHPWGSQTPPVQHWPPWGCGKAVANNLSAWERKHQSLEETFTSSEKLRCLSLNSCLNRWRVYVLPIVYTPARDIINAQSLLGNHQAEWSCKNKSLNTTGKAPDINAFLRMPVNVVLEIIIIMLYL